MHRGENSGVLRRASAAGALLVVGLLAAPAFACTPSPTLTANPMSAEPGATINVTGNNFDAAGNPVRIQMIDAQSSAVSGQWFQPTDEKGSFTRAVTLRNDLQPGDYIVIARQTRSQDVPMEGRLQSTFRVLAPGEQPKDPDPGSSTGQQTAPPQGNTSPAAQPASSASDSAASNPAATEPAAATTAASPAASPAARPAPVANRGAATATPVPVASVEAAAVPVAAEEPTAPVAPVADPAATPSVRSSASDLWSGFNGRSTAEVPSLAGPAEAAPADSLSSGIALLVVGTLMLLAGAGVAGIRRTRVRAHR